MDLFSLVAALEWTGSLLGITGAALLATKSRHSALSWPLWLVSNLCLIIFALSNHHYGLAVQQFAFFAINLIGVRVWLFHRPASEAPVPELPPDDANDAAPR